MNVVHLLAVLLALALVLAAPDPLALALPVLDQVDLDLLVLARMSVELMVTAAMHPPVPLAVVTVEHAKRKIGVVVKKVVMEMVNVNLPHLLLFPIVVGSTVLFSTEPVTPTQLFALEPKLGQPKLIPWTLRSLVVVEHLLNQKLILQEPL